MVHDEDTRRKISPVKLAMVALGLILLAILVKILLPSSGPTRSAEANQIRSNAEERILAEGMVTTSPGGSVSIGSEVSGLVEEVRVEEGSRVKKGDVLIVFRNHDLKAALTEAEAHAAEAKSEFEYARSEADRLRAVVKSAGLSRQDLDKALHLMATSAHRSTAQDAAAERLRAELEKTVILSPIDGVVTSRRIHPGETVEQIVTLLTLANLTTIRIDAEIDEFDVGRIKKGMPVEVTAEGYFMDTWKGVIEEVPDALTERRLRPQDPGRPTDTLVLLTRIRPTGPLPLKLKQRVLVSVLLGGSTAE